MKDKKEQWLVVYTNITTWEEETAWFEKESKARKFVAERLERQKECYEGYLANRVWLYPPNINVL